VTIGELAERRDALNSRLADAGVAVSVVAGGELDLPEAADLPDTELAQICLGSGSYLLVESPYTSTAESLERGLFALQARGFRVVLAHPERSPSFAE
jgi:protein-tyrosine phosphatase